MVAKGKELIEKQVRVSVIEETRKWMTDGNETSCAVSTSSGPPINGI